MRTKTVVVEQVEIAPGVWADVECEVLPDQPAHRRGHPDNWTPAEPGWAQPLSAVVTLDEVPGFGLTIEGLALESLIRAHIEAIEMRARELAGGEG